MLLHGESLTKPKSDGVAPRLEVDQELALTLFQIFTGALLVAHFVNLSQELPKLLSSESPYCLAASSLQGARAPWPCHVGAGSLRLLLASGAGLSAAIGVGLAPRVLAALLYLSCVSLMHAIGPLTLADDLMAAWVLLWTALLPMRRVGAKRRLADGAAWVIAAFTASWLFLNIQINLWQALGTSWPTRAWAPLGLILVPLCALFPSALAHWSAFVIAAACHVAMFEHHDGFVATGLVCASGLFVLSGPAVWRRTSTQKLRTTGAVGLLVFSVLVLGGLAEMLGVRSIVARSHSLLSSLGLAVDTAVTALRRDKSAMFLETEDRPGAFVRSPIKSTGRARVGWSLVSQPMSVQRQVREGLAKTLVTSLCNQDEAHGRSGFVIASRTGMETRVGWFDCTDASSNFVISEDHLASDTVTETM
jgi:hypothetical protein